MGWFDEGRKKREAQDAAAAQQRAIHEHGGIGEPGSADPNDFVVLAWSAHYLGGWNRLPAVTSIRINCEGVTFLESAGYMTVPAEIDRLPWGEVAWVEVADASEERSRAAETFFLGVAGLGMKRQDDFVELLFHLHDGRIAAFRLNSIRAVQVRARGAATLRAAGIGFDQPGNGPVDGLVAQLERLAELHRSGAITDEEFADFKQQLRS